MKVLAWLAFPLIATVAAMGWAAWRGRADRLGPRRSGGLTGVEEFRRFTEALAVPRPAAAPGPRPGVRGLVRRLTGTTITGQGS